MLSVAASPPPASHGLPRAPAPRAMRRTRGSTFASWRPRLTVGALSGGERRFLLLAASLVEDVPVVLGDVVPGLDRVNLDLVLAAVAHAGGSHQHSDIETKEDGSMVLHRGYLDALYPWPQASPAAS